MATSKMIIIRTIAAFLPELVTDATKLRHVAEWTVAERKLSWEKWMDVRDEWAKYYALLPLVLTVVGAVRELCMPLLKLVRRLA